MRASLLFVALCCTIAAIYAETTPDPIKGGTRIGFAPWRPQVKADARVDLMPKKRCGGGRRWAPTSKAPIPATGGTGSGVEKVDEVVDELVDPPRPCGGEVVVTRKPCGGGGGADGNDVTETAEAASTVAHNEATTTEGRRRFFPFPGGPFGSRGFRGYGPYQTGRDRFGRRRYGRDPFNRGGLFDTRAFRRRPPFGRGFDGRRWS